MAATLSANVVVFNVLPVLLFVQEVVSLASITALTYCAAVFIPAVLQKLAPATTVFPALGGTLPVT